MTSTRQRSKEGIVSIRLDNRTLDAMKDIAQKSGRSLSAVARDALQAYVDARTWEVGTRRPKGSLLRVERGELGEESNEMKRDLATLLKEARDQAPEGDVVVRIHLFGIDHATELQGVNLNALVESAGVPRPYATEVRKGMRLAEYVGRK